MVEGGGAPPPEAVRGGAAKGVSIVVAIIIAVVTFVAGLGIGALFLAPAPTTAAVTHLFVGTNTPFPPFEFRNATTDIIEGFDIDLIGAILTRSGYTFEMNDFRDFGALLTAVGEGKMDVAVSAITMNGALGAERNQTMSFSDPYYESDQAILALTSDTRTFCADTNDCQASELNLATYKVAFQTLTSSQYWAEDNLGNATLSDYPDVTQVLQTLSSGAVDFVVIDRPAAVGIAAGNAQFRVAGTIQTDELYAFAVAHGDPLGLLPKINSALAVLKSNGTYDTLVNKWF